MSTDRFYVLYDDSDVIYVSDDLNDSIKTGVEWFFKKFDGVLETKHNVSKISAFHRSIIHDQAPRYGEELLCFNIQNVPNILKRYERVHEPDRAIINLLQKWLMNKDLLVKQKKQLDDIDESIKALQHKKGMLTAELKDTYSNPIIRLTERVLDDISDAEERKTESGRLEQERIERANIQGASFGYHRSIDVTLVEDRHDNDECDICAKTNNVLYMVEMSDDANRPYTEYDTTLRSGLLCVQCLEAKFTDIGCARYSLPLTTYDDVF